MEKQRNMPRLLRQIYEERGAAYLREENGKLFVNAFSEMGGDRQDVTLLRYLTQCGAHEDLLDAAALTPAMQKAYYSQAVQKLRDRTLISEELAHRVCGDFWRAVYNSEPPEYTLRQPAPVPAQPVKSAEELYREAQNCNDQPRKVRLLQQAADRGHTEAMLHLGFAYEYGNGIGKNAYEAVKWFRKAAELGFAPAQDRLAYCYDKGVGLDRNLDRAIEWCQKACDQDFPGGARHLRQLKEKQIRENPSPAPGAPVQEFEIVGGALLRYNGKAAEVTVPANVTSIRATAFAGNQTLRSVHLPKGLVGLANQAFSGCTGLKTISIPGSVIAVNLDSFTGCSGLRKITLESGIQKLNFGDHLDQLGRVTIEIPDSVTSVTWTNRPGNQSAARMKHPKNIVASERWTSRLQDFFSENPDFRPGKPRRFSWKKAALVGVAVLLVLLVLGRVMDSNSDKRTRSDLAPYDLEDSVEDMLLAGTEEVYTYPDDTRMEFYYDDAGNEIYRVYVNTENEIEYLFEARYDSSGRLFYHQSFDGEGNLLRTDSYDFHSSEDTAQRRVTLPDGRNFQGISTFDENGYETFTVIHEDGTQTVYVYKDGGVLTNLTEYDAAGEIVAQPIAYEWWENQPKVYGPRQTVIGWAGSNGYVRPYVLGICGGALKEYSVSVEDDYAIIETYDPMGNLLEQLHYCDSQLNELSSHDVHTYDSQGNYTGYTETFYFNGNYYITVYDENLIRLSLESHCFDGEEEIIFYERYETELDDQGREIRVQTFDGETGRLQSIKEFEYDSQGNRQKRTHTSFHEDGGYSVYVEDGEGKDLSDVTYYPSGNIRWQTEYNDAGEKIKSTWYYENGKKEWFREWNDQGEVINEVHYNEDGTVRE